MLGTENYGIVSIYTTWVQVLSIVMGIQTGGTIAVSKAYFEEEEQNAYFSSTLFLFLHHFCCDNAVDSHLYTADIRLYEIGPSHCFVNAFSKFRLLCNQFCDAEIHLCQGSIKEFLGFGTGFHFLCDYFLNSDC